MDGRGGDLFDFEKKISSLRFSSIFGFRSDDKGIHTSRTMILAELSALLAE
jgi:hypothetical protein